jgi:predicted RND superfamily exporter protein
MASKEFVVRLADAGCRRIVHYVYNHYVRIVLLSSLLSGFCGYMATGLTLNTNLAELLPEHYPSVQTLNQIKEEVGHTRPLLVVITSDDLEAARQYGIELSARLEGNPHLSWQRLRSDRDFFVKNRLLYMDLEDLRTVSERVEEFVEQKKVEQSPLYFSLDDEETVLDLSDIESKYAERETDNGLDDEFFLTKKGDGIILILYPTGDFADMGFTNQLLTSVQGTIDELKTAGRADGVEVGLAGSFTNQANDYNMAVGDARRTALYGIAGVLLLIMVYFRHVLAPLAIVFPLAMSLSWTFGVAYVTVGELNQVTMILFAVLFGLGIDFGIHIFARYREARGRRELGSEEALLETLSQTGRALVTTAVTTSVAFSSLMIMDFKAFSDFGFIASIGILLSLVATIVVCPAFIVMGEKLGLIDFRHSAAVGMPKRRAYPIPRLTLAIGALVTAYSLYGVADLQVEYNFEKLRYQPPNAGLEANLPDRMRAESSPAIVLTQTASEALEVVSEVERIRELDPNSTIKSVRSVHSVIPSDQEEKLQIIGELRQLIDTDAVDVIPDDQRARVDSLRDLLDLEPIELADLPEGVTTPFTNKEGQILNFVAISASVLLHDGLNAIRFAKEIGKINLPSGSSYFASSSNIVFADVLQVVEADSRVAMAITFLIVFAVVLLDFRKFSEAILVMAPLAAALLWVAGIMHGWDLRFDLYNIVVFPTIAGMGIVNAVHILHRYREEGRGSLMLVLGTTGKSVAATTLTTMAGFSGLVLVRHPGLNSMGLLALIGLACCFIAAVALLPAILQAREKDQSVRS